MRGRVHVLRSVNAVLLAHAGHWATSLLYLVPIVGLVAWIWIQNRRDRRRGVDPDTDLEAYDEPTLDEILDGDDR